MIELYVTYVADVDEGQWHVATPYGPLTHIYMLSTWNSNVSDMFLKQKKENVQIKIP